MSGTADSHRITKAHKAKQAIPNRSSHCGAFAPMGTSNQMVRRRSSSFSAKGVRFGFRKAGSTNIRGMKSKILKIPIRENISDTRVSGLRQWLLVTRNIEAARGAAPVTINMNENMAA